MELKPVLLYGDTLWLGDRQDASNMKWLQEKKIRHIVNVGHKYGRPSWFDTYAKANNVDEKIQNINCPIKLHANLPSNIKSYTEVYAYDDENYPILDHLNDIKPILDISVFGDDTHHIKEGVLINCHMGINRSASLAAAYISKVFNKPTQMVIDSMRKYRPVIQNKGFMRQLIDFKPDM